MITDAERLNEFLRKAAAISVVPPDLPATPANGSFIIVANNGKLEWRFFPLPPTPRLQRVRSRLSQFFQRFAGSARGSLTNGG